jgi:calcineurin-like phosphoesterase family protein
MSSEYIPPVGDPDPGLFDKMRGLWRRFFREFAIEPEPVEPAEPEEPRVFVIGDTHFGHQNIIKYAARPYRTVGGMNKSMIHKWNQTVRVQDSVFFLGDFAWRNIGYYITHLNGKKTFITGNHDEGLRHTQDQAVIEYGDHRFLLIHRPQDRPSKWDGWTIHGHVHRNAPFIDRVTKRINVSADVIGFRPVSLHRIVEILSLMETYGHDVMPTRKDAAWLRAKATAQEGTS